MTNLKMITTKDAQIVLDKTPRQVRRLLKKIREKSGKKRYQPVTIQEFCEYFMFRMEDVYEKLQWK